MAWRIAGDRINKHYRKALPSNSTVNGFFNSSDLGKLVEASSNLAALHVGTSDAVSAGSILGILAVVPAATTPGSTDDFIYIQPIAPGELVEVDYSTASTDIGSTNFFLATTNIGSWLRVAGAGTSSGDNSAAQFVDPTTGQTTLAGSTVGILMLTSYSTTRKVVTGILASSVLA